MKKKALICGISGQDGAYLAALLLQRGYEVSGTSRDAHAANFRNLEQLQIKNQIRLLSMAPNDFRSVLQALEREKPDEVYNLAGQSSVGLSFEQPVETLDSIAAATINFLESIRFLDRGIRFYNAASSECFGDTHGMPANESTPFHPRSPYAAAKCAAYWFVANYREAYGLHACSGLLFNHESPLRTERFVTSKIAHAAARIACGSDEKLKLGNLAIQRDWGWAPEYVEAMWRMLQADEPEDYVIATGRTEPLEVFLDFCFSSVGLRWPDHVMIDPSLKRPSDLSHGRADPSKARRKLDWQATRQVDEVAESLTKAALSHYQTRGIS